MINARELTEEETKTLKKKALEILSVCRRDILTKYPFIGSIALRMEMVPVRDVRVRTACTDGNSVYFDIAFLSSLSREEQSFVLAHEIWHAVLMHLVRRHDRIPEIFNIATDKEVNALLQKDGFTPPKDVLFPDKDEEDKCAEEIYEMLLKKAQKQNSGNQSQKQKNSNGNSSNGGSQSQSQQSKSKSGKSSSGGNGQPQQNKNGQQNDNETGELTGQFDKHIYDGMEDGNKSNKKNGSNGSNGQPQQNGNDEGEGEGAGGGSNYGEVTDKYGKVGFDSDYQPKVSKDFADKMRETIVAEAQRYEKMRGNLPAHIKALVKKVTSAEVPWQEVLARFVTRCYNSGKRSWIPPNRRHVHNGLYLQSRQADKIRLACIIDTSGSTVGDRGKFLAELNSLIKSFGLYDLWIVEIDAQIGAIKHYTQDDYLEQEIENGKYAMTGGGGTELIDGFKAVIDEQMEVDAVVCLTDGYIDNILENPTGLPTLWVITKDGTEDFCNWGEKIRLKISDSNL